MTPEEHAHLQRLEALVKRYRRRIVELKEAWKKIGQPPPPDLVDDVDGEHRDHP